MAASVDSKEDTRKFAADLRLTFLVGYGVDAEQASALTGAYYEPKKKFLHATGFILKPEGVVAAAVYSTGPIGRFAAADALDIVTSLSKKAATQT